MIRPEHTSDIVVVGGEPNGAGAAAVNVVVGDDPNGTGKTAIDLARAEARRRPVILVDLIGTAPALREIAITDDPHGVADCFEYGVSFSAVCRPTTVHPALSVIPYGSEPVPFDRALLSPRWDRLIEAAREAGGLLIFAVLTGTPGLAGLITHADRVIGPRIEAPPTPTIETGPPTLEYVPPLRARSRHRGAREVEPQASMPRSLATGLIAAAAVAVVAVGWWLIGRPGLTALNDRPATASSVTTSRTDTTTSAAQLAATTADPAGRGASPDAASLNLIDPRDSSLAATFAVRVASFQSYADALRALRRHSAEWRAITIAPIAESGTESGTVSGPAGAAPKLPSPRFLLIAGAARTRPGLDSMVTRWSSAPGLGGNAVIKTPYALRLGASLPADSARRTASSLITRGIPAYALVDDSGSQSLYAGAFATTDQAALLAASLRAAGVTGVVAYRTGRVP